MKKNKNKIKIIFIASVILLIFFSSLHPIFAQYRNQEKIPGASQQQTEFIPYLKDIINFGFAILGILALFMLIIGAYQYLMAAGSIGKADSAKETIGSALLGLILGLCAWVILNKINPDLVNMRAISQISGGSGGIGGAGGAGGTGGMGSGTTGNYDKVPLSGTTKERVESYDDLIKQAHEKYPNVPIEVIKAVMDQESRGDPGATSPRGAMGLMQLMPGTANDLGVKDAYDPGQNIMGGTRYLDQLYDRFGSWEGAAAAYNMGPTGYQRVLDGTKDMPAETVKYVPLVMGKIESYT